MLRKVLYVDFSIVFFSKSYRTYNKKLTFSLFYPFFNSNVLFILLSVFCIVLLRKYRCLMRCLLVQIANANARERIAKKDMFSSDIYHFSLNLL